MRQQYRPLQTILSPTVFSSANPMFELISNKEMATAQIRNAFCVDILRRPSKGVELPLVDNDDGIPCPVVTHNRIVIPRTLNDYVIHTFQKARLAGHSAGRNCTTLIEKMWVGRY